MFVLQWEPGIPEPRARTLEFSLRVPILVQKGEVNPTLKSKAHCTSTSTRVSFSLFVLAGGPKANFLLGVAPLLYLKKGILDVLA